MAVVSFLLRPICERDRRLRLNVLASLVLARFEGNPGGNVHRLKLLEDCWRGGVRRVRQVISLRRQFILLQQPRADGTYEAWQHMAATPER